jgi:hypothetical protein
MKIKIKENSKSRPVWVESDSFIEEGILPFIPPSSYTHPSTHPASIITEDISRNFITVGQKNNIHASGSDNQDLSSFVTTSDSRLNDSRNAADVYTWAKAPVKPSYINSEVGAEQANANIQTHVTAAHAPATAQKNSDITDSEIKAKYVTPAYNSVYRTILDSTGSHIAAKVAGTYGIPQGNPLAISGTGTLYALNTIYIDSADYPTIDGKVTKLRVRCIIACNDVAPFTGTFKIGLHPVTRPATSGGAGVCIYTIGSPVTGSQVTGTNLAADSINNLVGTDFDLPVNGFYVLAVVTSATMATSSHVHISANLQIRNA